MSDDAGQTVNGSDSHISNSDDSEFWPQSYKVYNVTVNIPIVAHSEAQAIKRTEDMMTFLSTLSNNEQGPHQAARYLFDDTSVQDAHYSHEDTFESRRDMGVGMASDREFLFDWWDPDSDADYDPYVLAEAMYFCGFDDDGTDAILANPTDRE